MKFNRKFITRLGVATLTFWFVTIDASMAEWGVGVPISHPRFCEKQEIRVGGLADYLYGLILKRNMDTSMTGYIDSRHTWYWRKQIVSAAGTALEKMPYKRGIECRRTANVATKLFEAIWQDVLRYDPNNPSTHPCKIVRNGCR